MINKTLEKVFDSLSLIWGMSGLFTVAVALGMDKPYPGWIIPILLLGTTWIIAVLGYFFYMEFAYVWRR